MKPRIRKLNGLWHCMANGVWGMGYDPKQAYDEWAALRVALWRGEVR